MNKIWTILVVCSMLLVGSTQPVFGDEDLGAFDGGGGGWRYYGGFEFKGAKGSSEVMATDGVDGSGCLRIRGDFSGGGSYVGAQTPLRPFVPARGVRFMARSSSVSRVMVRATDFTGQTHQLNVPLEPDGQWQELTIEPLNQGERYGHFGGAIDDGQWYPPMRRLFIGFDRKAIVAPAITGELDLDNVRTIAEPPAKPDRAPARAPATVFITLERQTRVSDGMAARGGDKGKIVIDTRAAKPCWVTDRQNECTMVYFNVDDTRVFGPVARMKIEVTYLDEGLEPIRLEFADAQGTAVEAGRLPRRNTRRWVTIAVEPRDVLLENRLNDEDFRLSADQGEIAVGKVQALIWR